jgi:hypothetical protein
MRMDLFMDTPNTISIIVDNFDRSYLLPLLMKSYAREPFRQCSVEMVIVDDASGPEDHFKENVKMAVERIKPWFEVRAYRIPKSTHFNGGRTLNVAARQSRGQILIINPPDVIPLTPGFLEKIYTGHTQVDWLYLCPLFLRSDDLTQIGEYLLGGASLPKKMFDHLGGFDEKFIGYGNVDGDFMNRIVYYAPLSGLNWSKRLDKDMVFLHLEQTKVPIRVDNPELRVSVTMENWKARTISVNPQGYGICPELEAIYP